MEYQSNMATLIDNFYNMVYLKKGLEKPNQHRTGV